MNEREMLEMAAKASGFELRFSPEWHDVGEPQIRVNRGRCTDWEYWNPLRDDGHALRLAVNLDMQIIVNRVDGFVRVIAGYNGEIVIEEEFGDDMYAATRLAITRAAAQIGKAMP